MRKVFWISEELLKKNKQENFNEKHLIINTYSDFLRIFFVSHSF